MAACQEKHYYPSKANCYGGSISPAEFAKLKRELAEVEAQAEQTSAKLEQLVNSLMDIKDFAGKTTFRAFAPN